jgi:hypothetical protein
VSVVVSVVADVDRRTVAVAGGARHDVLIAGLCRDLRDQRADTVRLA